ncbi:MAG: DUF4373 domain-containing protein [Ruminococcaceae bacterium]|nr:DUF4373 domain-containing protein [Oscillospiraceae bacterium]
MPRSAKKGLDFCPFDIILSKEEEAVKKEIGGIYASVLHPLLVRIYGGEGYFIKWDRELAEVFCKEEMLSRDKVDRVIDSCINNGVFDKEIYEKYSVLTSRNIQCKYLKYTHRRVNSYIVKEYSLIEAKDISVTETENICNRNVISATETDNICNRNVISAAETENICNRNVISATETDNICNRNVISAAETDNICNRNVISAAETDNICNRNVISATETDNICNRNVISAAETDNICNRNVISAAETNDDLYNNNINNNINNNNSLSLSFNLINNKNNNKKRYGIYKNVILTDGEYREIEELCDDVEYSINYLSKGLKTYGENMKYSYIHYIKKWISEGKLKGKNKKKEKNEIFDYNIDSLDAAESECVNKAFNEQKQMIARYLSKLKA